MEYLKAGFLGLIQGFTEFLPVSSSGHLAIAKNLFNISVDSISFDILLHLGTLLPVLIIYRRDVVGIIKEFFAAISEVFRGKGLNWRKNESRILMIMLIIGTIPAVIAGLFIKGFVERVAGDFLWVVGICLFLTAFLLWFADKIVSGHTGAGEMRWEKAAGIGVFQAAAILPGLSRSGATIVGGLLNGLSREFAVKFSFLLSIPAILGAAVLDFKDMIGGGAAVSGAELFGVLIAAICGYMAIKFLIVLISRSKLYVFSYYCVAAGVAALIINFMK